MTFELSTRYFIFLLLIAASSPSLADDTGRRNPRPPKLVITFGEECVKPFKEMGTKPPAPKPELPPIPLLEQLTSEAKTLSKNEDWTAAIPAWKKVLAEDPDQIRAYKNLGVAYFRVGLRQESLDAYETAAKKCSGRRNCMNEVIGIAFYNHDPEGALVASTEAMRHFYNDDVILFRHANILNSTGRPNDAAAILSGIVERDPKNLKARLYLCDILVKEGKYDEAINRLATKFWNDQRFYTNLIPKQRKKVAIAMLNAYIQAEKFEIANGAVDRILKYLANDNAILKRAITIKKALNRTEEAKELEKRLARLKEPEVSEVAEDGAMSDLPHDP